MILTVNIKFKVENEQKAQELMKCMFGPAAEMGKVKGNFIRFDKEVMSEAELEDMISYVDELPQGVAEKADIPFEYDASLDTLDEFIQIQIEFNGEKYRYQSIEEEAYYVGEKKDGRIRLRGSDDDEHARFFD